jgi:UDP-glucose 4-epimerase
MGIKRVVYISSKSVYDRVKGEYGHPTYQPINEDYTKAPRTIYGVTKLFGENMGLSYHRIYGLDFIALRFASTYGPGKLTRHGTGMDSGPLSHTTHSQIIESAMLGRPLKIPGGGDQVNDMVYNRDVANGIVLACFVPNPNHRIFHLGTGKRETIRHVVEIVNSIFGKELIEVGPGLGTENPCIFDISRAQQELGYSPQYSLEEGIKDYIETMKRLDIAPVAIS